MVTAAITLIAALSRAVASATVLDSSAIRSMIWLSWRLSSATDLIASLSLWLSLAMSRDARAMSTLVRLS